MFTACVFWMMKIMTTNEYEDARDQAGAQAADPGMRAPALARRLRRVRRGRTGWEPLAEARCWSGPAAGASVMALFFPSGASR